MTEPILDVANLRVYDPVGKQLVCAAQLRVYPGETVALVGASGAGKTILVRALVGLLDAPLRAQVDSQHFAGVAVSSEPQLRDRQLAQLRRKHLGYVNQDAQASLDPLQKVRAALAEQALLNGTKKAAAQLAAALQLAGADESLLRMYPHELSGGMRQRVLIAAALVCEPQLIIADEPTSALDPHIGNRVLQTLLRARQDSAGLLLISHDTEIVAKYADRILLVESGVLRECTAAELLRRSKTEAMDTAGAAAGSAASSYDFAFSAGYRRGENAVHELEFSLQKGAVTAFIGESGSGKTTAAKTVLGLMPYVTHRSGVARQPPRAAWVPQDTRSSMLRGMMVAQVLGEALNTAARRTGSKRITKEQAQERAIKLLAAVQLPPQVVGKKVAELSGGQVQRLALARVLAADPELLILDEPVAALDAQSRFAIVQLLQRVQAQRGLSTLLISHEMSSVRALATRVYVFDRGRIVESGNVTEIFSSPTTAATQALVV
ncbi:ATP-binding cassette domain-containing protein [Canibacter sp. lx-72]|nr:ATP-binding cassette domain-containing protein [Canibacter zhuwentaonis]MBT1018484.1 ATP-binding cassette domain-containing protein [Canibacter zhuwentaonis]